MQPLPRNLMQAKVPILDNRVCNNIQASRVCVGVPVTNPGGPKGACGVRSRLIFIKKSISTNKKKFFYFYREIVEVL